MRTHATSGLSAPVRQGQIFNIESEAPELKGGSETSSGGMKVVLDASLAQDAAVVLTLLIVRLDFRKQE